MRKSASSKTNQVRIGAGVWRSRLLKFADSPGLRPTPDRVRQTLFNWLGQDLTGKTCLDLFAGTGVLALEALSRNASKVIMVESSSLVAKVIAANLLELEAISAQLLHEDAQSFLTRNQQCFDVIFLDPPYRQGWVEKILPQLLSHLTKRGVVYVETEYLLVPPIPWRLLKQGKAGNVYYHLIEFTHD